MSFTAAAVVNGATFAAGIAPGGVVSIFGTGLAGPGKTTTVDMDESRCRILFATPFQINAEVPLTMAPGVHSYADAVGIRIGAADCYGFGGGSGYLLGRQSADRGDYESELQSDRTIQPATSGTVDGYLCHRAGRGDTERTSFR